MSKKNHKAFAWEVVKAVFAALGKLLAIVLLVVNSVVLSLLTHLNTLLKKIISNNDE